MQMNSQLYVLGYYIIGFQEQEPEWPQSQSEHLTEDKNLFYLLAIEPQFFGHPTHNLVTVTILPQISRLACCLTAVLSFLFPYFRLTTLLHSHSAIP